MGRGLDLMEKHKYVTFLMNTCLEPLEKHKATDVCHHLSASEAPLKWRFTSARMVACFCYWV